MTITDADFPCIALDAAQARELIQRVRARDIAADLAQAARDLAARDAMIDVLRLEPPATRVPRARSPLAALFARSREAGEGDDTDPIAASGLFLAAWYRDRNADLLGGEDGWTHFIATGLAGGLAPNPFFDPGWYAGRYLAGSDEPAFLHYLRTGARYLCAPGPLFDAQAYLLANPDIAGEPDALAHFLTRGIDEGRRAIPVRLPD